MKKILLSLSLSLGLTLSGIAQQNLFNISSGAITPKGKVFYQHQLNVHALDNMASKHHLVYGLGSNWEIGLNVVNIGLQPFQSRTNRAANDALIPYKPHGPLVMLTTQKQFRISNTLAVNVGTQAGLSIPNQGKSSRWSHFTYGLLVYETEKHLRIVAGPYYSDRFMLGKGNQGGLIAGFELPVTKRFFLMGDFVSGRTKGSVSVLGGFYNVTPHFQLCLGGLIPNPESKERLGIVLEVNLFNF